jgi:hypothetical protein
MLNNYNESQAEPDARAMRRLIFGLLGIIFLVLASTTMSGAKVKPRSKKPPNALTVSGGCWAPAAYLKTGCTYPENRPQAPADFVVSETLVGETQETSIKYVSLINVTSACLGTYTYSPARGAPFQLDFTTQALKHMRISRTGKFSYHGTTVIAGEGDAPTMDVSGQFMTDKTAKVTFFVHYKSCKRQTMTFKWTHHPGGA